MSGIIKELMEANKVRFYYDLRTGSLRDLSPDNRAVISTPNSPRVAIYSRGAALAPGVSGYMNISPTGLGPVSNVIGLFFLLTPITTYAAAGTKNFSAGTGAANRLQLYFSTSASINAYNGTSASSSGPAATALLGQRRQFLGCTFGGGAVSDFFVDGVRYAGNAAISYSGDPAAMYLMQAAPCQMYASIAVDMTGVTDANVAQLYRELSEAPGVVRRPRRTFSIPHPTKTPAQYSAESVTFDLRGDTVSGKMPDVVSGAYPATLVGPWDVARGNSPFTNGVYLGPAAYGDLPAAANNECFQGNYSVEAWITPRDVSAGNKAALSAASFNYVGRSGSSMLISIRDNVGAQQTAVGYANTVRVDVTSHFVWVLQQSGPLLVANMYVNGQSAGMVLFAFGTSMSVSTLDVLVNAITSGPVSPFVGVYHQLKYYKNNALNLTSVRREYLVGARKCTLDAMVHRDGSCPVTITARASGEVANGWKITRGTVNVQDDAVVGGNLSDRWIVRATTCTVSQRSKSVFGSWYFRARTNAANALDVMLVASNEREYAFGGNNGYLFELFTTGIYLLRITGGATAATLFSATNVLQAGVTYRFWITRDIYGYWAIWMRGGAYTTWTLVPATAGSNPTAADLTHLTSTHVSFASNGTHEFGGMRTFLGEMTADEAIAQELIVP